MIVWLIYALVRAVDWLLAGADPDRALSIARRLGRLMYRFYGRGRRRALEHLRAAYPDKDDAWVETTARRSFEHLVMMVFDVFMAPHLLHKHELERYFEVDWQEFLPVIRWIVEKRAIIMVTGHYGSFDVLGFSLTSFGLKMYSINRPLDNRPVNDFLRQMREKHGHVIIDKKGAAGMMTEVLSTGNILGLVADQNGSRKDVFVDFFGRKAATYKSIGLLAMRYNCPVVVGYCRRLDDRFRFEIRISRIIRPEQWEQQDNPLAWITQEYTRGIEDFVRKDPEQYWWLHRRWKTRPPEERGRNDSVIRKEPQIAQISQSKVQESTNS